MGASSKPPILRQINSARRWFRRHIRPLGGVAFGDLRRTSPVSNDWGFDRGLPVDRYYIESRYPNGFPEGSPADFFDKQIAVEAYDAAVRIYRFCEDIVG